MIKTADGSAAELLCEIRNHVAFITLNRPAALNALSLAMLVELQALLQRFAGEAQIRAIVLRGAGTKAFCAGGDLRALHRSFQESGSLHRRFFIEEYALDYQLHTYPKPYVVVMDGITMGGGMGLAQGSNLRVVGDRTRLAMPEVGIGLFPDVGASYFLSRLPGSLGIYLALTSVRIGAADALYSGLADVYLPPLAVASLDDDLTALEWTDDWSSDVRRSVHARASQAPAPPSLSAVRPAVDTHFSRPSVSAILASLDREDRDAYADWARQTARSMRGFSPTLLCVTLRQLHRGRSMSLADCFRMELGMVERCFEQGDFLEGVRALIIDKDNSPRWLPARLDEVTDSAVEAFFDERWRAADHPLAGIEGIP